ncbi:hypothetical protein BZA05DRAFT_22609 [Tricharina praecox]|uniref:uncharacterized protein n=1 Tax=Tricharina praecox TaxID=43433 RepID=UPI00221F14A1|nr:uncharacterized protein BZA05DRAFT_22609 [Tricharina praecox]KAI5859151.1 hypothetical protein BZA05DRAFT_22609 [Tricharina praecox]
MDGWTGPIMRTSHTWVGKSTWLAIYCAASASRQLTRPGGWNAQFPFPFPFPFHIPTRIPAGSNSMYSTRRRVRCLLSYHIPSRVPSTHPHPNPNQTMDTLHTCWFLCLMLCHAIQHSPLHTLPCLALPCPAAQCPVPASLSSRVSSRPSIRKSCFKALTGRQCSAAAAGLVGFRAETLAAEEAEDGPRAPTVSPTVSPTLTPTATTAAAS